MSSIVGKIFSLQFAQQNVPQLVGRKYIVTGGTNGIGLSVSRTLYSHGADVTILGSQQATADAAVAYIKTGELARAPQDYQDSFSGILGTWTDNSADGAKESGEVRARVVDFKDLKAVAKVAKDLAGSLDRLDGFLGIAGLGVNKFTLTDDGFDSHLTINVLSHQLLLSHLLPVLEKTSKEHPDADVRVVLEASELHRTTFGGPSESFGGDKFRTVDEFKKDVGQQNLYARTKLGQILLTKALVQRYLSPPSKILGYSVHPGAVATDESLLPPLALALAGLLPALEPDLLSFSQLRQTRQYKEAYGNAVGGLVEAAVRPIMRAADEGALSALWAATAPDARDPKYENGTYFSDPAQKGGETSEASDQELIDNLWSTGLEVIKQVVGEDNVGGFKA
ncbi:hypothetical protein JCM3775_003266 [Rhodotorula graminis]|uniref:Ketoreductase (KR) domain-containing protein n=1 Tax=Rhodotorula graminis (strain WP1) TaxID=578459 RepID=A0A0P9EK02_RHOGW|nr:uncharacterized protein RHOBADRAFT_54549 [Rhodotorula graminis WP1]KPV73967.1 hypothetical protein RHOBADRAFT_54549 [Rhodotorula graminis WP1]